LITDATHTWSIGFVVAIDHSGAARAASILSYLGSGHEKPNWHPSVAQRAASRSEADDLEAAPPL